MKPTCIIIDDEPMARKGLAEDLEAIGLLSLQAAVADPVAAMSIMRTQPPDLLFLDIEMPEKSGLDFLNELAMPPMVVLVTAYAQYALKGYDHGVIDYLLKPVSEGRLRSACEKAVERFASLSGRNIFLKHNGSFEQVRIADILFIEGANNYIRVRLTDKKLLVYQSLKGIVEQLPATEFIQVHKSFVVARRHIQQVKGESVIVGGTEIPLSRRYKGRVFDDLQLTNNSRPVK